MWILGNTLVLLFSKCFIFAYLLASKFLGHPSRIVVFEQGSQPAMHIIPSLDQNPTTVFPHITSKFQYGLHNMILFSFIQALNIPYLSSTNPDYI